MPDDEALVDWQLAERTAAAVAGNAAEGADWSTEAVRRVFREALAATGDQTGLFAPDPPEPELVGRAEWSRVALSTLRAAAAGIERRATVGLAASGPLGVATRRVAGAATALEAGVAAGYAARRVVGQYDVALIGPPRPPRLLLVTENLEGTRHELGVEREPLLRWIALHESTHVVQFQGVPWLEGHLRVLLERLIAGAAKDLDFGRLTKRLLSSDPRRLVRSVLRGELARAVLGDEQRAELDRMQAAMALIEGHAEHVTEACAAELDPAAAEIGPLIAARRERRGGFSELLARLLGLEMKLRQYRLGKAFCDRVAAEAGSAALRRAWSSPEALPTLEELEAPTAWLARTGAPQPASV